MYPTQLHSYLLWRSSVDPNPQSLASRRYTATVSLLPAVMVGGFVFGWYAGLVLLASILAAFAADFVCHRFIFPNEPQRTRDGTWLLTGLLIALLLPPDIPLWLPAVGAVIAVVVGKYYLSVDGMPLLQPAAVGLLLLFCVGPFFHNPANRWPVLTRGVEASAQAAGQGEFSKLQLLRDFFAGDIRHSISRQAYRDAPMGNIPMVEPEHVRAQAVYGPRPLDLVKASPAHDLSRPPSSAGAGQPQYDQYDWLRLVLGYVPGTIGGSSALALGLGILLLVFSRSASPLIPCFALATMFAGLHFLAWLSGSGPDARVMTGNIPIHLMTGSTLLGIFYLAADPTAAPRSALGKVYAGVAVGVIELFLRIFLPLTEGLVLSVVIVQCLSFVIDQWLAPPSESKSPAVNMGWSPSRF